MTLLADSPTAARPATSEDVADAVLDGAWIVDVRAETTPRRCPVAVPRADTTYVGWLVPWEDDIVLLAGSPDVLDPHSGPRWR
jgi:hypothetical protein